MAPSDGLHAPADFAPHFRSVEARHGDAAVQCALQRLRFEVYCTECGFLPQGDYPDGREHDRWDAQSSHFGAVNAAGDVVGCVRLVRPGADGRLPFQDHCAELMPDVTLPPPQAAGEISRLLVHPHYRRRAGDTLAGVNAATADARPVVPERRSPSPQILLSLFRCLYGRSRDDGVLWWYAAMERSLARVLRGMGFEFRQIGPQTDYFGPVAPYLAELRVLEDSLSQRNPALLQWMRQQGPGVAG